MSEEKDSKNVPSTRKGRPPKEQRGRGRPKGMETVMKEYRMRMLNSPKSRKVLDSIFEVAMDTEHKHWPAASKMVMDRIAPQISFVEDAGGKTSGSSTPQVNITISGLKATTSSTVDGEFEEIDGD